jgi:conserved hypothetical protein
MLAKTKVTEVQVYRGSATVTRCGETELKAGRNILFVSGMTKSAKSDSFKLKFPEKIRAVNIQLVDISALGNDEQKESERIQKQIDEIKYQIETCDMMIDLRKKNCDFSNRTNISVDEQEKIMDALPEQLAKLHKERDEFAERQNILSEELGKALEEEEKPLIMAELVADEDMQVPFILQYQEGSSSWVPKYEIEYSDDRSPLSVSMKAQIRQSSGEDWKQIKVTLYTGNPSISKELPVMPTVELSLYEPPKAVRSSAKGAMNAMMESAPMAGAVADNMMMGAAMMSAAMDMSALKMDTAEVSEEETMTAFILPNLRDVLSDTDGNIAELQAFTVKAKYNVLAVPSMDDKCFLTAEIVASEWPLPAANAAVYLRDTFAGNVYVDPGADTETLTLSLGQDERITVVRTEAPKKTQDVFLKNTKKQLCKTSIRVVNNSSEAVNLVVKDQIPVSTDKSIVVDVSNFSDGILDEETGEVKWNILAEPDKTETFELEYNISWPKDKKLTERRVGGTERKKFCNICGAQVFGKFCPECGSPSR